MIAHKIPILVGVKGYLHTLFMYIISFLDPGTPMHVLVGKNDNTSLLGSIRA